MAVNVSFESKRMAHISLYYINQHRPLEDSPFTLTKKTVRTSDLSAISPHLHGAIMKKQDPHRH